MPRRNYDFKFPDADGNYWYLIWIGKIHYSKRQKKVMLFFINTTSCNDYVRYFKENSIYKTLVPVSYLPDFHIGMIYSSLDKKFVSYEIARSSKFSLKVQQQESTYERIPVLNNSYYSFLNNEGSIDIECMKYIRSIDRKEIPVFVTPYCIAEFLFFRSDRLVNKILSGELLDGFNLGKANFYFDEESNQRVVRLLFDQSQVDKEDAFIIAPYLFLRNGIGIKFIKGIHSNLHSTLHNSIRSLESSAYLRFNLNLLSNYSITLEGKYHYVGEENIFREHQVFIAYRITDFKISKDAFCVDRIDLIPYNSKTSTEDRRNHDIINVSRPISPDSEIYSLVVNQEATSSYPSTIDKQKTDQKRSLEVDVRIISREEQQDAYKVTPFTLGQIEGLTRELENLDNSVNYYKENIKKEFDSIELIPNFLYFKRLVQELIDRFQLDINKNPFKIEDSKSLVSIEGFKLDIVEIHFELKFFYLVEFGKGFIGIFNCYKRINPMDLEVILIDFMKLSDELLKGQVLWTLVNNRKELYRKRYGVEIQTGIEHKRRAKEGEVYASPSEIIYYDRIKRSL